MVNTTSGLKNINLLTKEQFDGISDLASDELYAVSGSGIGFPGSSYEDLTLGASGSTYTAPANGYFYINKLTANTNQYIDINNNTKKYGIQEHAYVSGAGIKMITPVQKNDSVTISYSASGATNTFRFIYAEGE